MVRVLIMKKCYGLWRLMVWLSTLIIVSSMPQRNDNVPMSETIRKLTGQLIDVNASSHMMLDTRTPPKIKQQQEMREKLEKYEMSHPGIAEPIDEDALVLEDSTKRYYYKHDKGTTDSGLSTWILLSGQPSPTTNAPKKTPPPPKNVSNSFVIEDANKVIKPIFKRKTTILPTSKKVTTEATTRVNTTPSTITTTTLEKTIKLTKIKASLLNNKENGKKNTTSKTTISTPSVKTTTQTTITNKSTSAPTNKPTSSAPTNKPTTQYVKVTTKVTTPSDLIEDNGISPEAKEGTLELGGTKKVKRPPTITTSTSLKKKKTKIRRKPRPTIDDKIDINKNNTKIGHKHKEKPIGTQIYNYLSREVMPTVGVGLVGLMVTAGLASYFLYPFAPLRRSYQVDRKDKDNNYYYHDEYSGGIAEEDAIGKVIAGMPMNNNINTYSTRAQNSRFTYPNRYRHVDQYRGTVETVKLDHPNNYNNEEVIIGSPKKYYNHKEVYDENNNNKNMEKIDEQQFVVGNVPVELITESATPISVPEHGPRQMEDNEKVFIVQSVAPKENLDVYSPSAEQGPRRRRRQVNDEVDNEIDSEMNKVDSSTSMIGITTNNSNTTGPTYGLMEKPESFLELLKDLFYYKLRLSLQILQDKTESLSRYFRRVQERMDQSYREAEKNKNVR